VIVTGERAVTAAGGFNPSWQRHRANYALAAPILPPGGKVLDLGCGVGHSVDLLEPRPSVGVDVDQEVLSGQGRETVVADMRELPFDGGEFSSIAAMHSIEHVPDPERVVAECARVLRDDGVAVLTTPNRLTFASPDEIIDPYHYIELSPGELEDLCGLAFNEVRLRGIFGSAEYMRFFTAERRRMRALLRVDFLRLRRAIPRRARQLLYDAALSLARRRITPLAESISVADFELRDEGLDECLDVVAICRSPRRPSSSAS
jgi:SAM-dependent methyltransferase